MVLFLIVIKKCCKVLDVNKFFLLFIFEECKIECEFLFLILRFEFKCKYFDNLEKYFYLYGGIFFVCEILFV